MAGNNEKIKSSFLFNYFKKKKRSSKFLTSSTCSTNMGEQIIKIKTDVGLRSFISKYLTGFFVLDVIVLVGMGYVLSLLFEERNLINKTRDALISFILGIFISLGVGFLLFKHFKKGEDVVYSYVTFSRFMGYLILSFYLVVYHIGVFLVFYAIGRISSYWYVMMGAFLISMSIPFILSTYSGHNLITIYKNENTKITILSKLFTLFGRIEEKKEFGLLDNVLPIAVFRYSSRQFSLLVPPFDHKDFLGNGNFLDEGEVKINKGLELSPNYLYSIYIVDPSFSKKKVNNKEMQELQAALSEIEVLVNNGECENVVLELSKYIKVKLVSFEIISEEAKEIIKL